MRLLLVFVVVCSAAIAQTDLFTASYLPGPRALSPHRKRERAVFLNSGALDAKDPVRLNLFEEQSYITTVAIRASEGRHRIYLGKIEGMPKSDVVIAVDGPIVSGNITTENGDRFQIRTLADGSTVVRESDPSSYGREAPPLEATLSAPAVAQPGISDPAIDNLTRIDVMVLYTPAAAAAAGGSEALNNLIEMTVAETNLGYSQSGIKQRIQLVYQGPIAFPEEASYSMSSTLSKLTNSDGFLDDALTWRENYGADLVSLWTAQMDYCGISWQLTSIQSPNSPAGFNVVNWACATGNYAFAHELGHNMGANHDRDNATGLGLFPYSYGFRYTAGRSPFRTIMAYDCSDQGMSCPRLNYWSNPNLTLENVPAGISQGSFMEADNAATLNASREFIASYRAESGLAGRQ